MKSCQISCSEDHCNLSKMVLWKTIVEDFHWRNIDTFYTYILTCFGEVWNIMVSGDSAKLQHLNHLSLDHETFLIQNCLISRHICMFPSYFYWLIEISWYFYSLLITSHNSRVIFQSSYFLSKNVIICENCKETLQCYISNLYYMDTRNR